MQHTEAVAGSQSIPLTQIAVEDGFNPRTYVGKDSLAELAQSIQAQGVIQPIVVRRVEDQDIPYRIVAGERRWRASKQAGLEDIPAIIRQLDDTQARAFAVIENTVREDMSVAEEARAAKELVSALDGDKKEAQQQLGWSQTKFDRRMLLLHACDEVLNALSQRQIKTGHAELLAGLPADSQPGTMQYVIKQNVSVAELKRQVDSFALSLSSAIFDKTDCLNCPHNSDQQNGLFTEAISRGHCLNRECFQAKTEEALEQKRQALSDEYNVVYLDTEKTAQSYTVLQRMGPSGVGSKQLAACQGCKYYGAMISSQPGKAGEVKTGLCFNLPCNEEKIEARQAEIHAGTETTAKTNTTAQPATPRPESHTVQRMQAEPETKATPGKVIVAADKAIREAAGHVVDQDAKLVTTLLMALAVHITRPSLQSLGNAVHSVDRLFEKIQTMNADQQKEICRAVAQTLLGNDEKAGYDRSDQARATSQTVINTQCPDITAHFVVDREFLEAHTIGGLVDLLTQAGFDSWYNEQTGDDKSFDRLTKKKKGVFIDAVLGKGDLAAAQPFDFTGFVPAVIKHRLERK